MDRLSTKILVDGGDPRETQQVKERLGFVDGQTTNPSLVAKNPHIQQRLAAGHKLTQSEELNAYREIVREIAPLVRTADPRNSTWRSPGKGSISARNSPRRACKSSQKITAKP